MSSPFKILNKNQVGSTAVLTLVAVVGLLSFLVFSNTGDFKDKLFNNLYPKPASQASTVLWSGDMEEGNLNDWYNPGSPANLGDACGGEFNDTTASTVASKDFAHSGTYSVKSTINATGSGDTGARLFRWCEAQNNLEAYYSAWYYFPQKVDVTGGWWNIFQWKSKILGAGIVDPFFTLNVANRPDGTMYVYFYDNNANKSYDQFKVDMPVGKWFQIESYYKCAGDNTGHVTLWQDGVQVFDIPNVQTKYPNGDCQWSVDNYSRKLTPALATIYVDDAVIATTYQGPNATYSTPTSTAIPTPVVTPAPTVASTPVMTQPPTPVPTLNSTINTRVPTVYEAENMTTTPGSFAIQVFNDFRASGKKGLIFYSDGTSTGSFTTTSATSRLIVRTRGEQCKGYPNMVVKIDGKQVMSNGISARSWTDYSVNTKLAAGNHEVAITFNNDYHRKNCDRNLMIDKITLAP